METLAENIHICKHTRQQAAETAVDIFKSSPNISESEFCKKWSENLYTNDIHQSGWYSPPPLGLAALFELESKPQRVAYDNLRKEEFWPKESNIFSRGSVGYIYASPIHKSSGIIGDFGMTIYSGQNEKILNHIENVLKISEAVAEFCKVGMELREIHNFCQKLMNESKLNNKRTLTYTDTAGTNIGHTLPWTFELPTAGEAEVIQDNNFDKLKNLISKKRIYLNNNETFKIPRTIAFTVEPRAESNENVSLPMASFHFIVSFTEGKKEIFGNFNSIFKSLNINIKSKY